MTLTIGSLFSGIGGLELGLEWAGVGHTVWQVESDPWCRGVLAKHWPNVKRFNDVRTVGADSLEQVDVICGGFPCQGFSNAGKRAGLADARSGLWREYARIVGELRPPVVVIENVAALVTRGLDVVVSDLCAAGYHVEGRIIAASDVGAPHGRDRLFLVAHARHDRCCELGEGHDGDRGDARRDVADGCPESPRGPVRQAQPGMGGNPHGPADRVERWPSRPGDPPAIWEPPRARKVTTPTTGKRLHALGNAAVPQCLLDVGRFALARWISSAKLSS